MEYADTYFTQARNVHALATKARGDTGNFQEHFLLHFGADRHKKQWPVGLPLAIAEHLE